MARSACQAARATPKAPNRATEPTSRTESSSNLARSQRLNRINMPPPHATPAAAFGAVIGEAGTGDMVESLVIFQEPRGHFHFRASSTLIVRNRKNTITDK